MSMDLHSIVRGDSEELVVRADRNQDVHVFDGALDIDALRETIFRLMRVETQEGLDRSPFALALFALDDIIEMVNTASTPEESDALEWLSDNLEHTRTGLLKLMREYPLGRPEREVTIPFGQEHLTSLPLEEIYERWESRPLGPEEKDALVEMKTLLECAESVIRFSCTTRMCGQSSTLLRGSLSDFCARWDQSSSPVIEGLCGLFPHLEEMIRDAIDPKKKFPVALSQEPLQKLIEMHRRGLDVD